MVHRGLFEPIEVVSEKSASLFASSYSFWEMVGATMWDIVIGCAALVGFGLALFIFAALVTVGWEALKSFVEYVRDQVEEA